MKTTKIKYTTIVFLALLMSTFTMFRSFANEDTIIIKKNEVVVKIDNDSINKRVTELENLIKDLLSKYDYLDINITFKHKNENHVESWMMDNNYFEDEAEKDVVEDWMLDDNYFSGENPEGESENEIKNWMMDDNYFDLEAEEGAIEDWMMEDNYFNN
ncbi:hypothetical protein ACFLRG_00445 [Bacteroidota bacterium]